MTRRTIVGGTLVAGLCLAAAAAIAALVTGDFGDTHGRVIATSLGFSLFTALGAAGDTLRQRADDWRVAVGVATIGTAAIAFILLVVAVWAADGSDGLWRAWGVFALTALCGSHASVVLRARRHDDTRGIVAMVWISIGAAVFATVVGDLAIVGAAEEVGDAFVRFVAVLLVIALLCTALPPILRRLGHASAAPDLATELAAMAERLDSVETPSEARREAVALRALAARARG